MRTRQNDSLAFELPVSTPRSLSFRLSLLVIVLVAVDSLGETRKSKVAANYPNTQRYPKILPERLVVV